MTTVLVHAPHIYHTLHIVAKGCERNGRTFAGKLVVVTLSSTEVSANGAQPEK